MQKSDLSKSAQAEKEDIVQALNELEAWFDERVKTMKGLQKYIQDGLQSGRISARRKDGTGKKYLSPRMIATLVVDGNQMSRGLMTIDLRRKQLNNRLKELERILEVEKQSQESA
ncbi:MAG: hypothetical protein RI953_594 [Pseudomonadota bacterium]|jgi:hypothetical protein